MTKTIEAVVRRRWLSPEDAVREVVAFERRFGETHLRLACHCGLLLILTPELVNLVRINFLDGEDIPWIAESNLLLSSLCRPLQEGIYEVEPCVREVLLVELENKFGWQRPFEIAEFLWFYLDNQPDIQQHPGLRRTQRWIAKAYLDPDSTIQEMNQVLDKGLAQDNLGLGLPGQGQIPHLVEILAEPLERTDLWDEYQYLVNTSRDVAKSLAGESQDVEKGEFVLSSPGVSSERFVSESAADALGETETYARIYRLIKLLNDEHYEVRSSVGGVLQKQSKLEEAQQAFERQIEIAKTLNDQSQLAIGLNCLGGVLQEEGKLEEAQQAFELQIEISKTINDQSQLAIGLNCLGGVLQEEGKLEEAQQAFERQIEIAKTLDDQSQLAIGLNRLGGVLQEQGFLEEAQHAFERTIEIEETLNNQSSLAIGLNCLGGVLQEQGKLEEAQQAFERQIEIAKTLNDQSQLAIGLNRLGGVLQEQGFLEEA
ncbi:MAG: tetratricopeptide repeat protein, partial [Moorea sp. SIO3I7]|nr:tetratricopeptide repeat protein [Moorena sp. SIO3I7]